MPADRKYDSVNLLPFLGGGQTGAPHERLFWRVGLQRAMREGAEKLVRHGRKPDELYDIGADIAESRDRAGVNETDARRMAAALDAWDKELVPPAFQGLEGRKAAVPPGNKSKPDKEPQSPD